MAAAEMQALGGRAAATKGAKMRPQMLSLFAVVLVSLFLVGCGGSAPTVVSEAPAEASTPEPAITSTSEPPTPTPAPPTATPILPTPTPIPPTPTSVPPTLPQFHQLPHQQVIFPKVKMKN